MEKETNLVVGTVYYIDSEFTKGRFIKEENGTLFFKGRKSKKLVYGTINGLIPFSSGSFNYEVSASQRL